MHLNKVLTAGNRLNSRSVGSISRGAQGAPLARAY